MLATLAPSAVKPPRPATVVAGAAVDALGKSQGALADILNGLEMPYEGMVATARTHAVQGVELLTELKTAPDRAVRTSAAALRDAKGALADILKLSEGNVYGKQATKVTQRAFDRLETAIERTVEDYDL